MLHRIEHIGIAVRDLDAAIKFFTEVLGFRVREMVESAEEKVKSAMLAAPSGGSDIELMGSTDPLGPVGRFIESRGEGLHHINLEVDDIDAASERLREAGVKLMHDHSPTFMGQRYNFAHPKDVFSVLTELSERKGSSHRQTG